MEGSGRKIERSAADQQIIPNRQTRIHPYLPFDLRLLIPPRKMGKLFKRANE